MALVKCKECGAKVSTKAKSCPQCGSKPPKKTSIVTWMVLGFILFVIYGAMKSESNLSPEQIKAREEQRIIKDKEQNAKEALIKEQEKTKKEEDKRKGFHCLNGWNGSHSGVEKAVKGAMKSPDSFEHIETRISPVNNKGTHQLSMKYQSANSFGVLIVGNASATVDNDSCQATITSID